MAKVAADPSRNNDTLTGIIIQCQLKCMNSNAPRQALMEEIDSYPNDIKHKLQRYFHWIY